MRYTDRLKAAAEHEHKRALAAEKEVMSLKIALDELTVLFTSWITRETIDRGRETDTGEYTLDYPLPRLKNLDDWQTEQSLTEDNRVKVTVRKRKEPGEAGREWRERRSGESR